jgi:hypothetical protein
MTMMVITFAMASVLGQSWDNGRTQQYRNDGKHQ